MTIPTHLARPVTTATCALCHKREVATDVEDFAGRWSFLVSPRLGVVELSSEAHLSVFVRETFMEERC